MSKLRLRFSKTGRIKYISHLDLMRTMKRAFIRAGVKLRYKEGFNPHPYMAFALPLPVGCESMCEIMDFELEDGVAFENLPEQLSGALPEGIAISAPYIAEQKASAIAWIEISGRMNYMDGVPDGAEDRLAEYFTADSIIIPKKTKRGMADLDIIPCISGIRFEAAGKNLLKMSAMISAQDPSLNPENIITAIKRDLPELAPDLTEFRRIEIYNGELSIFR